MNSRFSEEVFRTAAEGDFSLLRSVPKADLHAHGGLSCSFDRVKTIAPSVKMPPSSFANFDEFDRYLAENYFKLDRACFANLYEASLLTMIEDGIIYTEMSFDIYARAAMGMTTKEFVSWVSSLKDRYGDRITLCPEIGVYRGTPQEYWRDEIPTIIESGVYGSIDIYGAYDHGNVSDFTELFSMVQKAGLKVKYHSGEFVSNDTMLEDLTSFLPDAVQHGITSVHSENVLEILSKNRIPCNVCITSNQRLADIASITEHPIRRMFDSGIAVTLGTDDRAVFGSSLSDEYFKLYQSGLFSVSELEEIRQNGLQQANQYRN